MKLRIILVTLFILLGFTAAFATPQIPDVLVYEGKEYPIHGGFLSDYFKRFPERNPKSDDESCSALWQGFRATFGEDKGRIYLNDIEINVCFGTPTSGLKKAVPNGERLYIDWVSDLCVSAYGKNDEDTYSIESREAYEKYSLFEIDKGRVVEVRHFDNKGYRLFKKKQFDAYKATKDYDGELKAMLERNPTMSKSDADWNIEFSIFSRTKRFLIK